MPKAHETKAYIIEKTAAVFNKQGFAGTSVTDMENATGLTKGSIYNNFSGKDEVAIAAFEYNLGKIDTLVHRELSKHTSARAKLLAYVRLYSSEGARKSFPTGGCPVLNTAIEADDTHPALRKKVQAALQSWTSLLSSIIQEGIKKKEFHASTNPSDTAITILASIEGGIMISRVTGNRSHLSTVVQSLERLINEL